MSIKPHVINGGSSIKKVIYLIYHHLSSDGREKSSNITEISMRLHAEFGPYR